MKGANMKVSQKQVRALCLKANLDFFKLGREYFITAPNLVKGRVKLVFCNSSLSVIRAFLLDIIRQNEQKARAELIKKGVEKRASYFESIRANVKEPSLFDNVG